MSRTLSAAALMAPFVFATAWAQDVPTNPEQIEPPAEEQPEVMPEMDTDPAEVAPEAGEPMPESDPVADQPAPADGETIVQGQATNELRVDWITGTQVRSLQDESIGDIADLIIDQETNTITAAILSVGGFLGMGAKQIAVRFEDLQVDYDAREIRLGLTREEADAAPEYVFRDRTEAPAPPPASDAGSTLPPME